MRASKPFVEIVEGHTTVRAGDRVERDDGWWRAVRVTLWGVDSDDGSWSQSEIEWRPVDPGYPYVAGSLKIVVS